MFARIYVPAKNATQSGRASQTVWVLEYEPEQGSEVEPLMGWTSSGDMRAQVQMKFSSRDEAVAYPERNGIPYQVASAPRARKIRKRSYADNFKFGRKKGWTH
jgi:hypothetical protein